jgi:radical SAM superfamily enzyme YgiQ (UPF0313 family)
MNRKRSVILLQPKMGDMENFRDKPSPPLSLLNTALYLKDQYSIIIIDQRIDSNWQHSIKIALDQDPILIGITTLQGQMVNNALAMAAFSRKLSKLPIVWGGILVSLIPHIAIKNELVDIIVSGESEYTFLKLVKALDNDNWPQNIKGV